MKRHVVLLVAAACLAAGWLAPGRAAPQDAGGGGDDYRFERYVTPGAPGPNRLAIDVPLLAGGSPFSVMARRSDAGDAVAIALGGLGDLRFYGEDGREVAYLLVQPVPHAPQWVAGRILPIAATKKSSGFEADIGAARPVDRLAFAGLPAPYLKRARVEGSGDRVRWTLLAGEATVFNLPDEKLTRQEVEFPAGEFRYLRVTWDDTSSARVPLPVGVRARLVGAGAPPAVSRTPVPFERRASEPGISRYHLALPAPHLPVAALDLSVAGGYVLRQARVIEARLTGTQVSPVQLGSATLRRAIRDDLAAADMQIPLAAPEESELDLVVEDGNNPPLELTAVSLVFAELPWIYFESASGGPLLARYGSSRATAPRYDLEAARPSLEHVRIAQAAWGEPLALQPAAARTGPASVPAVGAPLDVAAFAHHRAIPPGPRGLTALRLDAAALANSQFADWRVARPDGRQVAYLVERLDEPLAVELPLTQAPGIATESMDRGQNQSTYQITLPEAGLPESRLVLTTPARVFSRAVRVLSQRVQPGARDDRRFDVVAEAAWRHSEPETAAPALVLALPRLLPRSLWLVVDEGDNSRLPLEAPRLLLPAYRLRFFRETDERLSLIYGNPSAAAPRYDLALLAPRLVGAPAGEVWPAGEDRPLPGTAGVFTTTRIFWAALVGAVVVLVVLLARLLRT